MPTVEIVYLTPLLEITGKRKDNIQIQDECILKDLLNKLAGMYGSKFKKLVLEENPYIVIMINGRSIPKHALEAELKEGDSILMGLLMGGG